MLSSPRLLLPRRTNASAVILRFVALGWLLFGTGVYAQELSVPGIKAPDEKKSSAKQELPVELKAALGLAPLAKLYDYLKVEPSKIRRLPALDARAIRAAKPDSKAFQIGTVRAFERPLRVSADAALYHVPEGEVSVIGVRSEGALYTRVRFKGMSLPVGARVFVYSLQNPNEYYGPYENKGASKDGTFWTPPIEGDGVGIEYFNPQPGTDAQGSPFQISEVSHIYRDPLSKEKITEKAAAGSCNLEVTSDWAEVAKSVGRLQFTRTGGEFVCTGTLLNNQSNDLTPYLLTANHCFSTQTEAQSLRVHWNYNTGDSPPAGTPRTDGANLLSTGTGSDYTFVRLTGALPAGLFFSGWEIAPTPNSTAITGIHHPRGSHKRISFGVTLAHNTAGLPGPSQNFTATRWNPNSGVTEPGSSGSGIWRGTPSNARLVGTLTGGDSSCDTPAGLDYYGSFNVTYQSIASYLSGSGSIGSCLTTPISTGQTINGALATTDCRQQHRGGSFTDLYSFNGIAGQRVSISMTASGFDAYLYLIAPNGAVVAFNDDSGGTLNSRIPANSGLFTLPATGAYTIEATSYDPARTGSYTLAFAGPVASLQLSASAIGEGGGRATARVVRSGDISNAATVDYTTSDTSGLAQCKPEPPSHVASARCDYAASLGTVRFAANETTKNIQIPIIDDAFAEGTETFTLTLRNPIGVNLGSVSAISMTITDNETVTGTSNPIFDTPFFVREHYLDFLGREPEQGGFTGWQNILNNCPAGDTTCDRIEVSSAFFRSEEFQTRGYFIYRFFSTSFRRLPTHAEFLSDFSKVSGFLTASELEANKVAFVNEFMNRQEFRSKYDSLTDAAAYVNALESTAAVTLSNKSQLINDLRARRKTRAQVLRAIAESNEVYQKYYNEAFVVMQYFGYLRRDPDILYKEWIKTMNQTGGDYRIMINGFMNSLEYRERFGP